MPTYDYRCNACGHEFELFQQMSAPVQRKCPECGKLKLERLIGTGAGILFKGGGFYETDYRSESYKKAAEAESKPAEAPKKEESSSSKTETAAPAPATGENAPTRKAETAAAGKRSSKTAKRPKKA